MDVEELIDKIFNENNLVTMARMPVGFISGIICSPPYNLQNNPNHRKVDASDYSLYDDEYDDNLTDEEYLNLRVAEFKEFDRILKPDGCICYNISYSKESPILPTLLMARVHNETNLTIADIISWKKNSASPFQTSPNKLTRIVELIYIIVHKDYLHTFKANKGVSKVNERTGQKFYKNYTNLIEAANNDGVDCQFKGVLFN